MGRWPKSPSCIWWNSSGATAILMAVYGQTIMVENTVTNVTMQVAVEVIMDDDSSASDSDSGQRDKHSAALLWSHTSCVGGNNHGGGGDDRGPWINSNSQPLSPFEH